ncbi:MAG TPA: hypothetical protein VMH00_03150 [Candidatus Limnocylindrales bacterium]|nr:hypothetical protein [Candidatus Limnocylindrales bacterium]
MMRHPIAKVLKFILFGVLFLVLFTVFTFLVMRLWNWLMPAIFGLHLITFWQALGILVLCRILFGGFRGRGPRRGFNGGWRGRMSQRWERMTPEERERFRERMRNCGPFGPTEAKPGA